MISGAYLPFVLLVLPTPLLEFASVKDNGGAVVSSSSWGLAFGALGLRHGDGVEREGGICLDQVIAVGREFCKVGF
jgi:hypothetical protein